MKISVGKEAAVVRDGLIFPRGFLSVKPNAHPHPHPHLSDASAEQKINTELQPSTMIPHPRLFDDWSTRFHV